MPRCSVLYETNSEHFFNLSAATVSADCAHQVTGMTPYTICWLLVAILIAKMLTTNTILTIPRQNTEIYKCIAFVTEYHI